MNAFFEVDFVVETPIRFSLKAILNFSRARAIQATETGFCAMLKSLKGLAFEGFYNVSFFGSKSNGEVNC